MRILSVDFETTCSVELKKSGASKYTKDHSFLVTVFAWAFDNGPVRSIVNEGLGVLDLPGEVVEHLRNGGVFRAWNAAFEEAVFRNHFGIDIKPEQVSCTMQRALHAGLPGALGDCGPALGLGIVKDATAHRLMMQMAKPRKHKGGGVSYWHMDDRAKLLRLQAYCEQDVRAEREIAKYIPELPPREKEIAALDRRANAKGIRIDTLLVDRMIHLANLETDRLNERCAKVTKGAVTSPGTQTARLVKWLNDKGLEIESLAKGEVGNAIKRVEELANGPEAEVQKRKAVARQLLECRRGDSSRALAYAFQSSPFADAREALAIRQLAAKSSIKKLQAMLACMEEDERARGLLAYYGASRTGRWSGKLIQPQNMVRPTFKNVNEAITLILQGAAVEEIEAVFPPILDVVASCLRGCLIPSEGKKFIDFDLSQIEARVIAWLSGQSDILEVFARGEDVYTYTKDNLGLNSRQEGKVAVLGLGYGMGPNKFIATAEGYGLEYSEEKAKRIVSDWRRANAKIVNFWWALDEGARDCIRIACARKDGRAKAQINDLVAIEITPARNGAPLMTMLLPSGRRLYYRDIRLEKELPIEEERDAKAALERGEIDNGEFCDILAELSQRKGLRESICYFGVNQMTKKWGKIRTYSGKLAENCCQAVARDVICDMALEVDKEKLGDLVLSVHDELLFEVPEDEAAEGYEGIKRIMNTAPTWAKGLPVGADGNPMDRFGK